MAIPVPTISATGITAPSYADILTGYQDAYWTIYGSDAVLTPDSQDGQWLAVQAQAYVYENNALYLMGVVNSQWAVVDKLSLVTSTPFTVESTGWRGLGVSINTPNDPFTPAGSVLPRWH